jgi:hypothetical protein
LITVTLSDLAFTLPGLQITGITPISIGNAAIDDGLGGPVPDVATFFSAASFGVTYSVPLNDDENQFFIAPGTDTFQVTVGQGGAAAPEPGTLALLGTGLATVGIIVCRKG